MSRLSNDFAVKVGKGFAPPHRRPHPEHTCSPTAGNAFAVSPRLTLRSSSVRSTSYCRLLFVAVVMGGKVPHLSRNSTRAEDCHAEASGLRSAVSEVDASSTPANPFSDIGRHIASISPLLTPVALEEVLETSCESVVGKIASMHRHEQGHGGSVDIRCNLHESTRSRK